MTTPNPFTPEQAAAVTVLDAMAIVAAERLRQRDKITRLRALREAAEADQATDERKT